MESLPAAAAHILECGGMKELGIFSQVSSTLAKAAQVSFKTRVRARYPSAALLFASTTGSADDAGVDWRGVYRRHWTMAARKINGQGHALPQPSRTPTRAFDDYIFVVEAFEGQSAPGAPWGTGEGTGLMSNARSLGVARAVPVLCGDSVKFRAEFSDEVFASTCVQDGSSMNVHGFVRVVVARASAPDKICLFHEGVAYDWGYYDGDDSDGDGEIYWAFFSPRAAFNIVADENSDQRIRDRKLNLAIDEPIVEVTYYANRTGPEYKEHPPYSEKNSGSSIELSFCDSRAKMTKFDACAPTASEVLFRLEHFLVFE